MTVTSAGALVRQGRSAVDRALRLGRTQRAVLSVLVDADGAVPVSYVRAKTGLSGAQVSNAMNRLFRNGFAEPVRPAKWIITRDGRRAVEVLSTKNPTRTAT